MRPGKIHSTCELKHIPKDMLEKGASYHGVISGYRGSSHTFMWTGEMFRCTLGNFYHIDDGRRLGRVYPLVRKQEWN